MWRVNASTRLAGLVEVQLPHPKYAEPVIYVSGCFHIKSAIHLDYILRVFI